MKVLSFIKSSSIRKDNLEGCGFLFGVWLVVRELGEAINKIFEGMGCKE